MIHTLAVADASGDPIGLLAQFGPLGVILALVVAGFLVPKPAYEAARQNEARWREAYEKERDGHAQTRAAYADAARSAVASTETAELAKAMLERLGHLPAGKEIH